MIYANVLKNHPNKDKILEILDVRLCDKIKKPKFEEDYIDNRKVMKPLKIDHYYNFIIKNFKIGKRWFQQEV